MATIDLASTSVVSGLGFTTTELAKVIGNTGTIAIHTGAVAVNSTLDGTFKFPMTNVPAGSTINSIVGLVHGSASVAGRRSFYTIGAYDGTHSALATNTTPLTTSYAWYSAQWTGAQLAAAGFTSAALRNDNIEWTASFISTNATSTTTSWAYFVIRVDYTLPTGGSGVLFFGESF